MSGDRERLLEDYRRAGRHASRLSILFRAAIAASAGLNVTDGECLDFLLDAGCATAGQLAEWTGLTTGAITSVIRRLERAGYATSRRDPADRRRVLITPRPENLAATMQRYQAYGARAAEILNAYTDEELRLLSRHHELMSALYQQEIEHLQTTPASREPTGVTGTEPAASSP